MSGTLDILGHCALVLCTVAAGAARENLATLRQVFAESCHIFIVYVGYFVCAKQANALFTAASSFLDHIVTSEYMPLA